MRMKRNNTGRWCAVRDTKTGNTIVEALIVDADAGRVRLQTGEHFGEARARGEYEFLEFVLPGEAPRPLAEEVATTNEP